MIKLGQTQKLHILNKTDFGVYLSDDVNSKEKVLLPKRQVPVDIDNLEEIEVFVYRDSEDRLISTTNKPYVELGGFAVLKVIDVTKVGAFLDWGLERDLFLPYKEMGKKVRVSDEVLIRLYIDKSDRLAASTKGIYSLLSTNHSYAIGDVVKGRIYEFGHDFGTFVAVDDKYSAMIPKHEDMSSKHLGDIVEATISNIKDDGKIDLTTKLKKAEQMDKDSEEILKLLESYSGVLPFSEKASPEVIFRETGMSKAAFKRAVGSLYKKRLITIDGGVIRLN